jgi:hypothetical protein
MTGAGGAKGGKAAVDAGGGVNEVSDVGAADADIDADTSGVDSEGEVEGVIEGGEVVGRCLDCAEPFDQFSGRVVCTVCRLPVLVCPRCREERCEPGEYHCWRHR